MNITDIDDKIIRGAAAEGIGIDELAERWIERFLEDAADPAHDDAGRPAPGDRPHPRDGRPRRAPARRRVTPTGPTDGSIFFRIASWPAYGRLARLDPEQLRVGERVEPPTSTRRTTSATSSCGRGPKAGEPSWETAIGTGRPGWHLECSAMSMRYLGETFDVHTGGVDLVFPHHEDEIAQSEAATGRPFVRTWLHCAHLQMGGRKMAKSEGNIARVADLLAGGVSPRALRYALLAGPLPDGPQLQRRVARRRGGGDRAPRRARCGARGVRGRPAGRPGAPRAARGGPRGVRRGARRRPRDLAGAGRALRPRPGAQPPPRRADDVDRRRRPAPWRRCATSTPCSASCRIRADALPADLVALLEARAAARAARDWAASDRLRDELAGHGVLVEDTRDGQRWRRAAGPAGA